MDDETDHSNDFSLFLDIINDDTIKILAIELMRKSDGTIRWTQFHDVNSCEERHNVIRTAARKFLIARANQPALNAFELTVAPVYPLLPQRS